MIEHLIKKTVESIRIKLNLLTECNQQMCCSVLLYKFLMVGVFIMSTDLEQITNKSIGYKYLKKRNISQASPAKAWPKHWVMKYELFSGKDILAELREQNC